MVHVEQSHLLGSPLGRYMYREEYLQLSPTIEQSIAHLRERGIHEYGYSPESMLTIDRGLAIARTHQMNEVESRRIRKFDKEPYIFHPLAMAREAMRMRQHPTIVAACLMHDVPEDVKLGVLQSSEDWMKHIGSAFADYDERDRLMRILRAELKTESFNGLKDKEAVVDFYTNTSLGKTALGYLEQLRGNGGEATARDREHIAEVLYDLNRTMSNSYIDKKGGGKEFDPSILIVKILDTWQNLQTPGFWKTQLTSPDKDAKTIAKLIRARVLTNVAEFLGMRKVASEMTQVIATLHDLDNADCPNIALLRELSQRSNGEKAEWEQRREVIEQRLSSSQENLNALRSQLSNHMHGTFDTVLQMPWVAQRADTFTTTTGQIIHYVRSDEPLWVISSARNKENGYYVETEPLPDSSALRALMYREMGRSVYDYAVKNAQEEIVARIRAEAPSPRYISVTKDKAFNPPPAGAVPERNMFHEKICDYTTKTKEGSIVPVSLQSIETRQVRLLEFMLSPQTFLTHANGEEDRPYVIMINGKVHLATNQTDVTVWEMAQSEGLQNPYVRYASASESSAVSVEQGDYHVLDKMVLQDNLPVRIMVVEDKKPEKPTLKHSGTVFPS